MDGPVEAVCSVAVVGCPPGRRRVVRDTMATTPAHHDVADLGLAEAGQARIGWADAQMPVLASIRERFARERPLEGITIAACLHVTTETANLMRTLIAGGAEVGLCASNPLSTNDEVAAALVDRYGIEVHAIHGEDTETYYRHIQAVADKGPQITMDDGADVISVVHGERTDLIEGLIGGTEETTTGVIRLRALEAQGKLAFPIVAVNEAQTKHLFDNRYGTGQSSFDGILRATNVLIAGRVVVIFGYGWCGKGVAMRAKGAGARGSRPARPNVEQFEMHDGRRINLLAEGRLVNLAAAEGHPAAVMDMSFANQALSAEWIVHHGEGLAPD